MSASDDQTVRLWDLATGVNAWRRHLFSGAEVQRFEGHGAWVNSVAVTPDGRFAVSGSWDRTLRLWDLSSCSEVRRFEGQGDWVSSVAVTPDGRFAVSGSWDRTLRLWDLQTGHSVALFTADTSVTSVACAHNDLFIAGSADGALHILKLVE